MGSTLSLIISVYVYNPNLFICDEQRIVIEFLETGGLINLGHESLLINMKLYRTTTHYLQSAAIIVLGFCLMVFGVRDIKNDIRTKL
jgi:hypothetical protein